MSAQIKFVNNTDSEVDFGLYCAPGTHYMNQWVDAGQTKTQDMQHPTARTVAAWLNSNTFYANNKNAYVTTCDFQDKVHYTIVLNDSGLTITS